MVVPGLQVAIPIGYIAGVFVLTKPWGYPKFQWCSLPIFLSIFYFPWFVFTNIDIIYHHKDKIPGLSQARADRIDRLVAVSTYTELIISSILLRLIFLVKARKICDILGRFRTFAKYRLGCFGGNTNTDVFVSLLVFVSTFGVAALEGLERYYYGHGRSWIREWFGATYHSIASVLLFTIPMLIPMQCAFGIIVAFTGYLSVIFQDYCQHVLDLVLERKWLGMTIVGPKLHSKSANKRADHKFTERDRQDVLEKFEIVREIFDLAHEIISPMVLVLLGGSCLALVMRAYDILLLRTKYILIARDACHLVNYISYYWVIQCGERVKNKIATMKRTLDDVLVNLSDITHDMEKKTIRDVQKTIKAWDWKFTALDVFVIDRGLVSGVVSLISTYVVVLVQLKVSDAPDVRKEFGS